MSASETTAPTPAPAQAPATAPSAPTVDLAETTPAQSSSPTWPELSEDHPLSKLFSQISQITEEASYNEVYGIELSPTNTFHTKLILQKFLRANANDVEKAKTQLLETLKWRKEFDPVKAMNEVFSKERFGGLGYILVLENVPESENKRDVVTFNVYGAVRDFKGTFGDIEGFLRWRIGIMERSIHKLGLKTATQPIPDYGQGPDPYQGYQVHDYRQISFFRMDPHIRAATKKTVHTLQSYYPETLSRKFFVNVPLIMGWAFQAMKLLAAKETARKFVALSYAEYLAGELGKGVPKEYGGEAESLDVIAETMTLTEGEEKGEE